MYVTIGEYLYANLNNWQLYDGFVLGLQQDTTDQSNVCFTSFVAFGDVIQQIVPYVATITAAGGPDNSVISGITTNAWEQPGTYAKIIKRLSESGSVFFTFYNNCYIDDLIITFGRTVNSISGLFNTATTAFAYILNNMDATQTTSIFYQMDADVTAASVMDFGTSIGIIFTSVFNIQVPNVQYNSFTSAVCSLYGTRRD